MTSLLLPLLFCVLVWWGSTWLILFLDTSSPRSFRVSLLIAGVLAMSALVAMALLGSVETPAAAYASFLCGILVWGWLEMSYLMGFVTGPWAQPCPAGAAGWRRFVLGVKTSLYHELAVVAMAGVLFVLTWGEPNQTGAWAFTVLWLMRWSSKLNIFLGVSNLNEDFFPEKVAYLKTFVRRKPMNWLFPWSVALGVLAIVKLVLLATADPADTFAAACWGLVASIALLGLLEHLFLVLPVADDALWRSAVQQRSVTDSTKAKTLVQTGR
ncbi:MAG: putative photosynthetic complex assembly protein PuhE [Xanthomonadales bacterium]|nr:putative photosynthetic complex assembly protein PuhE [Xanthomonadales bacterium]